MRYWFLLWYLNYFIPGRDWWLLMSGKLCAPQPRVTIIALLRHSPVWRNLPTQTINWMLLLPKGASLKVDLRWPCTQALCCYAGSTAVATLTEIRTNQIRTTRRRPHFICIPRRHVTGHHVWGGKVSYLSRLFTEYPLPFRKDISNYVTW